MKTIKSSSTEPLLVLDQLCFSYGTEHTLNQLSLSLNFGERIAITGCSGAGKSTLLNILGLLQDGFVGRFHFNGKDMLSASKTSREFERARHIGFVFQACYLLPYLTLEENVGLALKLTDAPADKVDALIEGVGLSHRRQHFPSQLSGGEQQRAAFARALAKEPLLLLADEPTGNLDDENTEKVLELIADPEIFSGAVMMVTHQNEVAQRFPRWFRLDAGTLKER